MHSFVDNKDRTWRVEINVSTVKRVNSLIVVDGEGLKLTDVQTVIEKIVDDPVLLCDVLYVLCENQAVAEDISDDDFGRAMAGDVLDAACEAFLEEVIDFLPPTKRALMRKIKQKQDQLSEKVIAKVMKKLEGTELDEQIEQAMEATETFRRASEPGDYSGSSRELLASTPDR